MSGVHIAPGMTERFAILDPAAGISGDMLLGALIAAGAPREWLQGVPSRLGLLGVTVEIRDVERCGITAVQVIVRAPDGSHESPGSAHAHRTGHAGDHRDHHHAPEPHGHAHTHGPHRHVGDLIRIIEDAPLSPWVQERAVAAFRAIGAAEAKVHGTDAESVALHEVGALDALVDIVGAVEGFEQLGIERIHNRPVAIGSGWVSAAHGTIPVPAPATAILLEGVRLAEGGPVAGEATTPTGAALLRVLSRGAPPATWRVLDGSAWGAGGRNPEGYPNALRLLIAETASETAEVVALATDIDDLNPEYLEPLRTALMAAGALDVQIWATQGKKGRVSFRVEALATPAAVDAVTTAFFRHSTTIGVRSWPMSRAALTRRVEHVRTEDGMDIRVKLADGPGGVRAKPEYDDIIELAAHSGRPAHEVAKELQERAVRLADRATVRRDNPTQKS